MNGAEFSFCKKVALVTGGSLGIGQTIAEALVRAGAAVAIVGRCAESLKKAKDALGGRVLTLPADVSDPAGVLRVVQETFERLGPVDVLINNAGIGRSIPFLETTFQDWREIMAVNLDGLFLVGQTVAKAMVRHGREGRIVNVASVSGLRAGKGRAAYGTSKAAVLHLTKQMAIELAPHGIAVNAVAPGPVDTPMTRSMHTPAVREAYRAAIPLGRYAQREEVANAALFLASPLSGGITGEVLAVDGGFSAAGLLV